MCDHLKTYYKAFGLQIESEYALPELSVSKQSEMVDVKIEMKDLTSVWLQHQKESNLVIDNRNVMFQIANTATYFVKDGKTIIVSPADGADERKVRLFILGTCMGIILMQRNILPLHGSAVSINGYVYAIVGESGAGKSTLASALIKKGYPLLSDDVIAVSLDEDNFPIVTPSYPQQKLWQESLDHFGMNSDELSPIFARETKFSVPVHRYFQPQAQRLMGVFELTIKDHGPVEWKTVNSLDRFRLLGEHTYRQYLLEHLGLLEWHFKMMSEIIKKVTLFRISRPTDSFTAHTITNLIENIVKKENRHEREKRLV